MTLARLQEKISNNLEQVSELRSMFIRNAQSARDQLLDDMSSYSRPQRPSERLGNIFASRRAGDDSRERRIELERERLRELERLREMERERMVAREQELAEMEKMWQLERENKDMELMLSHVSSYEQADELDEYA